MKRSSSPSQRYLLGFTLIELSIVLVIIGLIVGGVLVGRDLIKSSEIRAQLSQIEELTTAVNTFRVKYGFMPGDMPPTQAKQLGFFTFTGTDAGKGCTTYAYGNNDGLINLNNEAFPAWSHLSDAKLLKGNYGGVAGNLLTTASVCGTIAGDAIASPNTDADYAKLQPRAKIASAGIFMSLFANRYLAPYTDIVYSNTKKLNVLSIWTASSTNAPSPYQAYQLDTKVDDGFPTTGIVRDESTADLGTGTQMEDPTCTTSGATPIKYDLSTANANKNTCYTIDFLF